MKNRFIYLAILVVTFASCQPKFDCTTEETFMSSLELVNETLDTSEQQKLAESVFAISMLEGKIPTAIINEMLGEADVEQEIDSLYKKFHGMTYEDIISFADQMVEESNKQDLEKLYAKKAQQEAYDKVGSKLAFKATKVYKDPEGFSNWIYFDYDYSNAYDVDIKNVKFLKQYIHGNDTITAENFLNKEFNKGVSGSESAHFADAAFENLTEPELAHFSFEPVVIYSGDIMEDESIIYNKNHFTARDKKRLLELENK